MKLNKFIKTKFKMNNQNNYLPPTAIFLKKILKNYQKIKNCSKNMSFIILNNYLKVIKLRLMIIIIIIKIKIAVI